MKMTQILTTILLISSLTVTASKADVPLPYAGTVSAEGQAFRVNNTYTGPGRSYGAWFEAAAPEGRGLYGRSTSTVPDVNSYGGFFYAAGPKGRRVFGQSAGVQEGIGVKGWASCSRMAPGRSPPPEDRAPGAPSHPDVPLRVTTAAGCR